jgi:hypothetical protein
MHQNGGQSHRALVCLDNWHSSKSFRFKGPVTCDKKSNCTVVGHEHDRFDTIIRLLILLWEGQVHMHWHEPRSDSDGDSEER